MDSPRAQAVAIRAVEPRKTTTRVHRRKPATSFRWMIATSLALHAGAASVLARIVVYGGDRPAVVSNDEVEFDLTIRSTIARLATNEDEVPVSSTVSDDDASGDTLAPEVLLAMALASNVPSHATVVADAPIIEGEMPLADLDRHHVEPEPSSAPTTPSIPEAAAVSAGPTSQSKAPEEDLGIARGGDVAPASSTPVTNPSNITARAIDAVAASGDESSVMTIDAQPSSDVNPAPDYPRSARKKGWQGTVLLRVDVSAEGRAIAVEIAASSGHLILDETARDAVRNWHFRPARRAGVAVAGRVEIPITFRLQK